MQRLSCNKAAGLDEIPAEVLKHGGQTGMNELTYLLNLVWEQEWSPINGGTE